MKEEKDEVVEVMDLCKRERRDNIKSKLVELGIANQNRHVIFDDMC